MRRFSLPLQQYITTGNFIIPQHLFTFKTVYIITKTAPNKTISRCAHLHNSHVYKNATSILIAIYDCLATVYLNNHWTVAGCLCNNHWTITFLVNKVRIRVNICQWWYVTFYLCNIPTHMHLKKTCFAVCTLYGYISLYENQKEHCDIICTKQLLYGF